MNEVEENEEEGSETVVATPQFRASTVEHDVPSVHRSSASEQMMGYERGSRPRRPHTVRYSKFATGRKSERENESLNFEATSDFPDDLHINARLFGDFVIQVVKGCELAREMTPVKLIATFLTILYQAIFGNCIDPCSWETTSNSKSYSFNLFSSVGHTHGVRSEDGFYRVEEKEGEGSVTTFWFQPCEHMRFNYDAPKCDSCESCGGPLHCGETCSALQATSTGGYPVCTTLGLASNHSYSLINPEKPELGVIVKMIAPSSKKTCSLSVSVYCSSKQEELPKVVTKVSPGSCDYTTSIHHPAGCPVVTSVKGGGMGWFGTLLIVLLCGLIVYFAVGIAYRMTVLGVSGLEAFPNLDFWKALPHNIQLGFEAAISYVMGWYRRFTEPTYMRVNE